MKKCPFCAEEIQDEARFCKHCRNELEKKHSSAKGLLVVLLFLIGLGLFFSIFSSKEPSTPTTTPLQRPPTQTEQTSPVAEGVGTAEEPTPPNSGRSTTAYWLLQNPYAERGKLVEIDPRVWPLLLGRSVLKYSINESASRRIGYTGMIFNRMISENIALFDVEYMDVQSSGGPGLSTAGQLAVIIPPGKESPTTEQAWTVEPRGVMEGTNGFGATIQIPLVKFYGFTQTPVVPNENREPTNPTQSPEPPSRSEGGNSAVSNSPEVPAEVREQPSSSEKRTPDVASGDSPKDEVEETRSRQSPQAAAREQIDAPVPSFDCGRATTPSEQLICSDHRLASLEVEMVGAYKAALSALPENQRNQFRREHLEWFRNYAWACNSPTLERDDRYRCVEAYLSQHRGDLRESTTKRAVSSH